MYFVLLWRKRSLVNPEFDEANLEAELAKMAGREAAPHLHRGDTHRRLGQNSGAYSKLSSLSKLVESRNSAKDDDEARALGPSIAGMKDVVGTELRHNDKVGSRCRRCRAVAVAVAGAPSPLPSRCRCRCWSAVALF